MMVVTIRVSALMGKLDNTDARLSKIYIYTISIAARDMLLRELYRKGGQRR